MDLIIDGYNLLALDKRLDRGLEQSRNSLINNLVRYRQAKPMNLTVVFDGWRSGSASETRLVQDGIAIVYSRLGEKADAVVIRLAREKTLAQRWCRRTAKFVTPWNASARWRFTPTSLARSYNS
ncbi:MAG: NYN domain-containing protein [Candidatus Binatia bacterium]